MKKLLGILVLGLLVCSAVYAKPKPKKIVYESYSAVSFNEIFNNKYSSKPVKLSGELYLPNKKGEFPVVYLQHGTAHPKRHKNFFQKVIVEMHKENIAVFIGDSYTKRKIQQKDGWKLGLAARVLDGLNVLNALSKHKNINSNKIGITGYSYGGMVAFFTAYPKLLDLVTKGKQFAAYMPVYPGCDVIFKDMKLVNKPMLMLHAEFDDYAPTIDCINYVKKLKENGNSVELKIYKGAYHGFIRVREKEFIKSIGNFRNCKPGYVDDEGYWVYNGKQWKMSYLKAMSAIYKECGGEGVTIGGTKEEQKRAVEDTVTFFKTHLI
jgi:dienelactone hydrolase